MFCRRSLVYLNCNRRSISSAKHEPIKSNLIYKKERENKFQKSITYPHGFKVNSDIETFLDKYMYLDRGASLENENGINIAGRIHSIREMGKNLFFIDLHQNEFRIQVKAHKNHYQGDFRDIIPKLANGDIIGTRFIDIYVIILFYLYQTKCINF